MTDVIALFDFDGTLTFGDSFAPFLRLVAGPVRMLVGVALLSPLVVLYEFGLVGGSPLRKALAYVCFRGRSADVVRKLGGEYATTLDARMRAEALAALRSHQADGHAVVVVSASLGVYLEAYCRSLGVDVIATELEVRDGKLTGKYRGGDCTGAEKARRVRERYDLRRYAVVYAYGDTAEDDELLALAQRRFFRGREIKARP